MTSASAERAENRRLIQESATFIAAPDMLRKVRAGRFGLPGFDREDWKALAALGWISLRLPESRGGIGFGVVELCALAEQLGAGLAAGPIIQAIATAPLAPDDWIDRIGAGDALVVPAWQEARGMFGGGVETSLADGRLNGEKRYVPMAAGADAFIVTTRDGLALVERSASGLSMATDMLQDGSHFGTLRFIDTPAIAISGDFALAREEITLATAAYLLGVMRQAFAITGEYLAARQQFGKPIGSFQALQHRMVDLYIQIELTRASVLKAATVLDDSDDPGARLQAVSRAKARASDAAMLVTRQAIQLHGGIGFTDECDIGLYLRKAMVLANIYGSAAQHRMRFSRSSVGQEGL